MARIICHFFSVAFFRFALEQTAPDLKQKGPTMIVYRSSRTLILHASRYTRFLSTKSHPFVLSHPAEVDNDKNGRGRIVCITSGKGGVGKTTSAASFATGLAQRGHKTCVVDFDIGLRNLDIHLGAERRVIFDFVNVLLDECTLQQALIKDKREPNLSMLAASQTRDKESLTVEGVERVLADLAKSFDYVVLDSPAGIESGAKHAMYFADDAIVVTNPELSSCRDADKMVGFVWSKSRRAELGPEVTKPVSQTLLINRYDPERVSGREVSSWTFANTLLNTCTLSVVGGSRGILVDC